MRLANQALFVIGALLLLMLGSRSEAQGQSEDGPDALFADVAEVLERRCVQCHNDGDRQGDLSLLSGKDVFAFGYVDPGKPENSLLFEVIQGSEDSPASMPKSGAALSHDDVAVFRKWIAKGAVWPANVVLGFAEEEADFGWWSYQELAPTEVPLSTSSWGRTPVDAFIQRKLSEKGLVPSPRADRRTLIRRLTFDLHGLPPSPEAVRAFENDTDPLAYEKLVEQLLGSERYGERWARHWLDVVKYADTCGYDKDKLRPHAWPYRDYVIRSLNQDKPFGRFVEEQVAGDVVFPGIPDGVLGLGMLAAGPWDFIGHVEVPESKQDGLVARNLDRDDMVSNVINTFCSLTVQCARCHNHKFDPISQADYYGLQSVFGAVDRANRVYDLDPKVVKQRQTLKAELRETEQKRDSLRHVLNSEGQTELLRLQDLLKLKRKTLAVEKSDAFGYHSAISKTPTSEKWVTLTLDDLTTIDQVVLFPCHDEFHGIGPGFCFPERFQISISKDGMKWVVVDDRSKKDFPNPMLRPYRSRFPACESRFVRITVTQLPARVEDSDYAFALAEVQVLRELDSTFTSEHRVVEFQAASAARLVPVVSVEARDSIEAPVRWGKSNLIDGQYARASSEEQEEELQSTLASIQQLTKKLERMPEWQEQKVFDEQIKDLNQRLHSLPNGKLVYAAATDFPQQGNFRPTRGAIRDIRVLRRGNVSEPMEKAIPCVLRTSKHSMHQMNPARNEGERRAYLAKWLSSPENPFVWRSIVNRVWQHHFGRGIVATPNDFGRMGALPTHPDLLDWLAVQFRDSGQSLKDLHRLIVLSSVYQQASSGIDQVHVAQSNAIDSGNQFLWRMNRRRLDAEEIRDSVLFASGALNLKMGGPGFRLFELERPEHSPHFEYGKFDHRDAATYRRSIYRFVVRSQPDPWMSTLDCADSSQSTPKRTETLTALQALRLLNSRFNLAMAEVFAERLESDSASLHEQVRSGFLRALQREPTDQELLQLVSYAEEHGLQNLCRMLTNLNEFIYVD